MNIQKESPNKEKKSPKKTELMDIFENIIEVNSNEDEKPKRRNSFTGKNIFQKKMKEKKLEKNKKLIIENKKEEKQEKEILASIENDKNSLSSLKLDVNESNQNLETKKSIKISVISKLKRDKSYKTLKNNYNKIILDDKKSNISSSSFNRNFILKSELLKKDNSYDNPKEKEIMKKNFFLLLTNKTESQKENPFFKYFIGNNTEEKIDFKQNNENKKNIFSSTYIDNEEEEELNKEKNRFKDIVSNFDNKSIDKKYIIQQKIIDNKIDEDERIQEQKLKEKVYKILKCETCNNDLDNDKDINFENNNAQNNLNNQNNNINTNSQNDFNNNRKNLIQYSIQNNYINNNYNIQNQQRYINLNNGYYYPYTQQYSYNQNPMNKNAYQYYNQNYFNPNININNRFQNYKSNPYQYKNNQYQYNKNPYQYNNNNQYQYNNTNQNNELINNQNIYNINYLNNLDDISLAKMSLNLYKSQIGCKVIQTRIQANNKFANDLLFPELKNNLSQICCDLFGNYLIHSLLDVLSSENLNIFLSSIQEKLFDICLTENGSRVIQKFIEKIHNYPLLINKLIFCLNKKDIGIIFKSSYGNHLIQKFLVVIKEPELTNFIYNYLYKNFLDIVMSKYGVCVIQKGLSEGNNIQRKKIIDLILADLNKIIKDCFGNFLIQFIFFKFDKNKFNEILPIIEKIKENIVDFCTNQFSSSVIEKCFERNEIKIGEMIINCLLQYHSKDIIDILENPYGKYVIKKSFNFKNNFYRQAVMNAIINNIEKIYQNSELQKIVETIKQEYPEFSILLIQRGINY